MALDSNHITRCRYSPFAMHLTCERHGIAIVGVKIDWKNTKSHLNFINIDGNLDHLEID
jgi:hypothetical protein